MSVISGNAFDGDSLPTIDYSLRFDGVDDNLSRTFGTPTDNKKWTWSGWVKRSTLGAYQTIFCGDDGTSNNFFFLRFSTNDAIECLQMAGAATNLQVATTAVFRDPTAHFHLCLIYDSSNGTANDRVQIHVNGNRQTVAYTTGPFAQNTASQANVASRSHAIGRTLYASVNYFSGYISFPCFIDGTAYTPTDFAYTDPNGQWRSLSETALAALASAGGTNSFFLPFDSGASTTTLGYDASSKGNNWTLNNMVRAAGTTDCWMTDTPTNNFATFNSIKPAGGSGWYTANGNLDSTSGTSNSDGLQGYATIPCFNDKASYAEFLCVASAYSPITYVGCFSEDGTAYAYIVANGSSSPAGIATSFGAGNLIGVKRDPIGNTVQFFKDGTSLGTLALSSSKDVFFVTYGCGNVSRSQWTANFGQRGFTYTANQGSAYAVCTANLPAPTGAAAEPAKHFTALTRTGNGTSQSDTTAFQPDFVWTKCRSHSTSHALFDSVRGVTHELISDFTYPEGTQSAGVGLSSFNANGVTWGTDITGAAGTNFNLRTYIDWLWKAGGAPVTITANTVGNTIESQVSANVAAGFSIVSCNTTSAAGTIAHGLGAAPKMIIGVNRASPNGWFVYHKGMTSAAYYMLLDDTPGQSSNNAVWNSTPPTDYVFSQGSGAWNNAATAIFYCFAEVPSFSKIGSYVGNGDPNGPFVYCGFKPKYVLIKRTDAAASWVAFDSARSPYNGPYSVMGELYPDLPNLEGFDSNGEIDLLSNGFKLRSNASANKNASGGTYIFIAFAEAPFQWSNAK